MVRSFNKVNLMKSLASKNVDVESFGVEYIDYLCNILKSISMNQIKDFVNILLNARENGSNIYFIGNGGSAATASHFANDIAIGTKEFKKPFRVISLCDNNAIITAIGNDYGFEKIFSQQLEVLHQKKDVVGGISAAGNSINLTYLRQFPMFSLHLRPVPR